LEVYAFGAFGLRGFLAVVFLAAAGFFFAGVSAGIDETTASTAFSETGETAGASTLYGTSSTLGSACLLPKIDLKNPIMIDLLVDYL
jgi:hypothetical protein